MAHVHVPPAHSALRPRVAHRLFVNHPDLLASPNDPDFGKLIDLEMLVMPGGRERTADEFRALFQRAGFTVTAIVPTKSPLSVIEAR